MFRAWLSHDIGSNMCAQDSVVKWILEHSANREGMCVSLLEVGGANVLADFSKRNPLGSF